MSLESNIAELVSRTNALLNTYDAKEQGINTAVANALAAVGALWRDIIVDPVSGSDANIGTLASPVLTLDRALDLTTASSFSRILLLGDVTLTQRHTVYCPTIHIVGCRYVAGAINTYPQQMRTINWANESAVEWDGNRAIPAILFQGRVLRFTSVTVNIPTPPAGVAHVRMIDMTNGGALLFEASAIGASSAATTAVLAATWSPNQIIVGFGTTTIATAAKGHILDGVVAGADPNAVWSYRSNLTSL